MKNEKTSASNTLTPNQVKTQIFASIDAAEKAIASYNRRCGNRLSKEICEDLAVDACMQAFEKFHTYDPQKASVRTWLGQIAHNLAFNTLSRELKKVSLDFDRVHDVEEDEEGMEEEDEGIEEEDENEEKRKELISNNLIGNIKEPIKKPSFLNKKKKRENADKEIDIKENEDFDEHEDEDNNNYDNEEEEADEDSFIKEQYKSFNKLKKEKELLDKQKNEKEKKDIEMKNNFAIRKANKQVLEAKGITRKRKRYQGNAKLMNREKFYKKEKERKKLVKDYVGKPDVYTGEATGIRRDLIRSTKIH